MGRTVSGTSVDSAVWKGPSAPFQWARRRSGWRTRSTVWNAPFAFVVATASTTHLPARCASTRTFCPFRGGVSVPSTAAAPPNGEGFDGVASVSAPGPITSTWLVAVAVVLSDPVVVSVTVYVPAAAKVCAAVTPLAVVPSPKLHAYAVAADALASTVMPSGALPFATEVVNEAVAAFEPLDTACATPTTASRLAATRAVMR